MAMLDHMGEVLVLEFLTSLLSFPLILVLASFGENSRLTTFYIYVRLNLTYKYSYGNPVDSAVQSTRSFVV